LWGGLFIGGWVVGMVLAAFVPALAWMRFTTRRDDQRFRQMVIAARLGLLDKNTRLWRARSYSPIRFKGVKDAWHT
jgi:type IV secretion system protein VirB3